MERLKEIRKKKGFTQKQMANILGIAQSTYAGYESGARQPDNNMLISLSNYFDVTTDYLLGNEYNKVPAKVATDDEVVLIPLRVLGTASCGMGKINDGYGDCEMFSIPSEWIHGDSSNYFLCYAEGDSMQDVHIIDGSIVLLRYQPDLNNNQIGLFHLNGQEYIKRYKKFKEVILLESANEQYETMVVTADDDFRIIAKVEKVTITFQ